MLFFAWVAAQAAPSGFASAARTPHLKPDALNAVLDFSYWLLFTRVNVLLRARGLNPYLGFLHSAQDHYESLVYDLVEPFRARVDRMVLLALHRREVQLQQLTPPQDGAPGWRLGREAMGALAEAFERELATQRAGDPGSWLELLIAQVRLVESWACDGHQLRLYGLLEVKRPGARRGQPDFGTALEAEAG